MGKPSYKLKFQHFLEHRRKILQKSLAEIYFSWYLLQYPHYSFIEKYITFFFIPEEVSATSPLKKICMARNWRGFCLLIIASWCSLSEPDTSKHTIWKQTGADETNLCQKIFLLSWFEATPKKTKGMSYWVLLFSVASSAVHAPARRVSESIILELFCVFRAWLHSHVTCRLSIN